MQNLSIIQNKRLRKEVGIYLDQYQDKINCLQIIEGARTIMCNEHYSSSGY